MIATQTPTPPRRITFTTAEPGEATGFLEATYGSRLRIRARPDTDWRLSLTQVDAGAFSSSDIKIPADLTFGIAGRDDVIIDTVVQGSMRLDHGKDSDRVGPGDVLLVAQPHADWSAVTHEARIRAVVLPQSLLTEVAGGTPGAPAAPPQFLSLAPIAGGAARWRATSRFVDDLLAEPDAAASPLLLGPAARLLAATALATFPNTMLPAPTPADRTDAHPGTLRRAIAFIEANCDRDIGLADIARAACVTPRAVQLAFRRHLNTTPTAHLRTVRLAQAHRQLRDATPGEGTTVTEIAARWGFTPSRFTERYRAAYGVLPSSILRT